MWRNMWIGTSLLGGIDQVDNRCLWNKNLEIFANPYRRESFDTRGRRWLNTEKRCLKNSQVFICKCFLNKFWCMYDMLQRRRILGLASMILELKIKAKNGTYQFP